MDSRRLILGSWRGAPYRYGRRVRVVGERAAGVRQRTHPQLNRAVGHTSADLDFVWQNAVLASIPISICGHLGRLDR
jgi:hypothetical protein